MVMVAGLRFIQNSGFGVRRKVVDLSSLPANTLTKFADSLKIGLDFCR